MQWFNIFSTFLPPVYILFIQFILNAFDLTQWSWSTFYWILYDVDAVYVVICNIKLKQPLKITHHHRIIIVYVVGIEYEVTCLYISHSITIITIISLISSFLLSFIDAFFMLLLPFIPFLSFYMVRCDINFYWKPSSKWTIKRWEMAS